MEVRDILKINLDASSLEQDLKEKENFIDSIVKGVPFAYLLGKSEFYGLELDVNKDVLIPRPETEYLVDLVVQEFKGKVKNVLDVGTGSGAILLSLLKNNVGEAGVGVDISPEALSVAKKNAEKLGLKDKTKFIISDRLSNVEGYFDLIISNPPYIRAISHRDLVHDSVDAFEPHEALYLPDDFYNFWFEDFFQDIRNHLNGFFFMEGHELEVHNQAEILKRLGFQNVKVINDLSARPRFLKAEFRA